MSEPVFKELLPCSGRTLAEVIHSTARREYDEQREIVTEQTAAGILLTFGLGFEEWEQILEADLLRRKTDRTSNSITVRQSFKQLCNSVLMSGSGGQDRAEQKLEEFFSNVEQLQKSEFANFDTRIADIFNQLLKASHYGSTSELVERIHSNVDESRREKNAIATRMSRIRKVAEYVLEPDSSSARKLGEIHLQDKNDASNWLFDVSRAFIESKESLNRFVGSYEKPWYDLGHKVIERNELDTRQLYSRNSLRNVHLIERLLKTPIREDMKYMKLADESMDLSDRTKYRLREERSRYDFESEDVSMELKVSGKLYEAIFLLPPFASDFISELQIKLMEYVYKNHPDLELNVSASGRPSPTLRMSVTGLDIQRFGNLQLSVLKFVQSEVKKRR